MRIVSVNLNQRLGNSAARSRFKEWLSTQRPHLLVAQEPFKPAQLERPALDGYRLISTSSLISAWIADDLEWPTVIKHNERWHEIRFEGVAIHNVYLSPYSSKERRDLMLAMADAFEQAGRGPSVIVGDFNFAPRPEDGLFGNQASKFTKLPERLAFERLLQSWGLVDVMRPIDGSDSVFTFERVQQGELSRFRCDLGLVSATLLGSVAVTYDHRVRAKGEAFTDHSAIIVDLPTIELIASVGVVKSGSRTSVPRGNSSGEYVPISSEASHKTAIRRRAASQIARGLLGQGVLEKLGVRSILDFGCGYGEDVRSYRTAGFEAAGFDIEPGFGWSRPLGQEFDFVTLVFVVNVLPSIDDRLAAVNDAAQFLRGGGHILIAARSESAIAEAAKRGHWSTFNDGWISSPSKATFQKGISRAEIGWLLGASGLLIADCPLRLSSDVSWLVGRQPPDA
jgi:exonuclease III